MKKITIYAMALLLVSCSSNGWKAADAKKKCVDGLKTKNIPAEKVEKMCDCLAEKMTAKYKTEKEADADRAGISALMEECVK
jgi:hypothetical protein